jgi:hypothetical protein
MERSDKLKRDEVFKIDDSNLLEELSEMLQRNDRALIIPLIVHQMKKELERLPFTWFQKHNWVSVGDVAYEIAPLDDLEPEIFKKVFLNLIASPASEELWLMLNRASSFLAGVAIMKVIYQLPFRGLLPARRVGSGLFLSRDPLQSLEANHVYTQHQGFGVVVSHLRLYSEFGLELLPLATRIILPNQPIEIKQDLPDWVKLATIGGVACGDFNVPPDVPDERRG